MMMTSAIDQDRHNLRAKKFLMWIFLISSFMLFAALTSAFIVYTAGSPDRGIKTLLPQAFIYSTISIVLSSLTMHLAYRAAKRLQYGKQQAYLLATILLGVAFFVLQLQAWQTLIGQGIYFTNNNASQTFIYVFTGFHLLHIFAGIITLLFAWFGAWKKIPQVRNMYRMEMSSIFWHFVDVVWIYLYVFLLLNQ